MKVNKLNWITVTIFSSLGFAYGAGTTSLTDAYFSALDKNEGTAISEKQFVAADEKVSQAWGSVFPHLSLNGSYLKQDAPSVTTNSQLKSEQSTAKLTLIQPIFHGLRDFAALRGFEAKRRAATAQKKLQADTLYTQVSGQFYAVLSLEKELENLSALLDLTQQRSKDLLARVKIGRSRRSEWLTNEAQVANLKAQAENAKVQVTQAREQFHLLTQLDSSTSLVDSEEDFPPSSASLDLYLNLVEKRPDILAQKEAVVAQDEEVAVNRGQHYPSIDLTGNYYLHRTGILADSKWDVGVVASLPIFEGGIFQSQVREAIALREEKELQLAQTRRSAVKEIKNYFETYKSAITQYQTLKEALSISEESYKLTSKEFRSGLVTNLDVIQSLNTYQETKRQWDKTRYSIKSSFAALQASVGQVPERNEKRHSEK